MTEAHRQKLPRKMGCWEEKKERGVESDQEKKVRGPGVLLKKYYLLLYLAQIPVLHLLQISFLFACYSLFFFLYLTVFVFVVAASILFDVSLLILHVIIISSHSCKLSQKS